MMRITAYADRLLADLDRLDWPESIKTMQRNWIGRSDGARIDFPVAGRRASGSEVFTTRPDTLFGATYMVLAPEHPLVDALDRRRLAERHRPTRWTGGAADARATPSPPTAAGIGGQAATSSARSRAGTRPACSSAPTRSTRSTGQAIPVFIADYVLMGYGTGAIMAVPGQDQRDWEFADAFDLPIVRTVQPPTDFDGEAYTGDGPAINTRLPGRPGRRRRPSETIIEWLTATATASGTVTYKLRDWLFSRQRYWGEPFPIVYDETALPIALPDASCRSSCPRWTTTRRRPSTPTTRPRCRCRRWRGPTSG